MPKSKTNNFNNPTTSITAERDLKRLMRNNQHSLDQVLNDETLTKLQQITLSKLPIPSLLPDTADKAAEALNKLQQSQPDFGYSTEKKYPYITPQKPLDKMSATRNILAAKQSLPNEFSGFAFPDANTTLPMTSQQITKTREEEQEEAEYALKQAYKAADKEIKKYIKQRLQDEQNYKDMNEVMDYPESITEKLEREAQNKAKDQSFIRQYKNLGYDYNYLQEEMKAEKNTQDILKALKYTGLTVAAVSAPILALANPASWPFLIASILVPRIAKGLAPQDLSQALDAATNLQQAPDMADCFELAEIIKRLL